MGGGEGGRLVNLSLPPPIPRPPLRLASWCRLQESAWAGKLGGAEAQPVRCLGWETTTAQTQECFGWHRSSSRRLTVTPAPASI